MNKQDNDIMAGFDIRLENLEGAVEKITTNDLPHLADGVSSVKGQLKVLIPLVVSTFVLVLGLLIINIVG